MVAVDHLVAADLGVLEPIGLLLDSKNLDVVTQRALIAFQGEDVVGFLLKDCPGDVALTARRIDRHDGAFDCHHLKQFGNGDDFVRLVRHFDLAQNQALARGEGGDPCGPALWRPSSSSLSDLTWRRCMR